MLHMREFYTEREQERISERIERETLILRLRRDTKDGKCVFQIGNIRYQLNMTYFRLEILGTN